MLMSIIFHEKDSPVFSHLGNRRKIPSLCPARHCQISTAKSRMTLVTFATKVVVWESPSLSSAV